MEDYYSTWRDSFWHTKRIPSVGKNKNLETLQIDFRWEFTYYQIMNNFDKCLKRIRKFYKKDNNKQMRELKIIVNNFAKHINAIYNKKKTYKITKHFV